MWKTLTTHAATPKSAPTIAPTHLEDPEEMVPRLSKLPGMVHTCPVLPNENPTGGGELQLIRNKQVSVESERRTSESRRHTCKSNILHRRLLIQGLQPKTWPHQPWEPDNTKDQQSRSQQKKKAKLKVNSRRRQKFQYR